MKEFLREYPQSFFVTILSEDEYLELIKQN